MFDDWKQAWRQAVENFQREVRDAEPGAPLRIRAMERELASAAGALTKLEREIVQTRRDAEKERQEEAVCRRREGLARNVGDDETVRIAIEFATRHAQRAALLDRKAALLDEEHALLDQDINEMKRLLKEVAPTGPTVGAASPKESAALDDHDFNRLEHDARERAVDARLEELKKRMRAYPPPAPE